LIQTEWVIDAAGAGGELSVRELAGGEKGSYFRGVNVVARDRKNRSAVTGFRIRLTLSFLPVNDGGGKRVPVRPPGPCVFQPDPRSDALDGDPAIRR
jgi:hypothetical protein